MIAMPRIDLTRYVVGHRLATSLMSEVSLAWDRVLERRGVMKKLRVRPEEDAFARRFLREAGILAALEAPARRPPQRTADHPTRHLRRHRGLQRPEQFADHRPSPASDLYAAVVLAQPDRVAA